uniref:Putative eukaryotic translation initiation factor 6 eif-6 n=1 Tax=Ixodes ricinus TaxID=34613 RepID=A0A6B0U819_IXORI
MLSLNTVYHFFSTILSHLVPVCAAISFLRSPTVSSELHFTRTFLPSLSLQVISIISTRWLRFREPVK